MGLLQEAEEFLQEESEAQLAEELPASYSREDESVDLYLVLGQSLVTGDAQDQVTVIADSLDVIFNPEDLILGGGVVEPEQGDQIALPDGRVLEVNDLGDGEVFRYTGPYRKRIRVHCKHLLTSEIES